MSQWRPAAEQFPVQWYRCQPNQGRSPVASLLADPMQYLTNWYASLDAPICPLQLSLQRRTYEALLHV